MSFSSASELDDGKLCCSGISALMAEIVKLNAAEPPWLTVTAALRRETSDKGTRDLKANPYLGCCEKKAG
jgi:hypothetical protein